MKITELDRQMIEWWEKNDRVILTVAAIYPERVEWAKDHPELPWQSIGSSGWVPSRNPMWLPGAAYRIDPARQSLEPFGRDAAEETEDLYRRAIAAFGEEHQIHKAIEEMAELIVALNQWLKKPDVYRTRDVICEIADVQITVGQMAWLFDHKTSASKAAELFKFKKTRLERLIAERISDGG